MTRADKIIEGFKLGALGVGHKHVDLVPSDEVGDTNSVTIVKSRWMKDIPISDSWVDGLQWTESNEYKFFMRCREDYSSPKKKTFIIEIDGGPKLKVSFDRHFNGDTKHSIVVASYSFSAPSKEEAKKIFKSMGQQVLNAGSFGAALVSGKLGSGWEADSGLAGVVPGFTNAFSQYLFATSGLKKSSYASW